MSEISDSYDAKKLQYLKYVLGDDVQASGKRNDTITWFKQIIDEDTFIIVTKNLRRIKGLPVLVLDKNKVLYIKSWTFIAIQDVDTKEEYHAIKLRRHFFRPYTLQSPLYENMGFEHEDTFDSLYQIAMEQDKVDPKPTYKFISQSYKKKKKKKK